jgi:glycosyltransferase involved in cell wall biosynthesis
MRVLFLTSRFPYPPIGGDRNRVLNFIQALAESGHEVHLVSFDTALFPYTAGRITPLSRSLASMRVVRLPKFVSLARALAGLVGRAPLQAAYYESSRMRGVVKDALARVRPDLVYTHLFRMAPYALAEMQEHPAAWVLDLTDVVSSEMFRSLEYRHGLNRWIHREEGKRIEAYERHIAPLFDRCWVVGEREAKILAAMAPSAKIDVVPIGVDGTASASAKAPREPATILFFGFQRIFHNRDAARFLAREIFPIVRRAVPHAKLEIAGKASGSLRDVHGDGIEVLGYLEDPRTAFSRATLFAAPHRFAAGVQTKVLQALDAGLPVVTTPIVREGLEPIPGDLLRVGVAPEQIAAEIIALIRNPDIASELGARGRDWVRSRYRWEDAVHAFEAAAGVSRVLATPMASS